jgi:zinc transport system substrate-binding protein
MRGGSWLVALVLPLGGALAAPGCGREAAEPDPRPLVLVSVLPQLWFVERLGGDLVQSDVLLPPGANPASYEPSIEQLRALSETAIFVKVGHPHFPFERAWLERLLVDAGPLVVDASADLALDAQADPHVWVAPEHARAMARRIHAALVELLPEARPELDANLRAVLAEIDAVDGELSALLRDKRGAVFVVFHGAWGHLARAYGLEQLAIEVGQRSPDAKRLADVIERARSLGIEVVFAQPQFDPSAARVVADAIGARVESLDPLAYDWPANLRRVGRLLAEQARP